MRRCQRLKRMQTKQQQQKLKCKFECNLTHFDLFESDSNKFSVYFIN